LYNLVANESAVAQEGAMLGTLTLVGSVVGVTCGAVYLLWSLICPRPTMRMEQCGSTVLVMSSVAAFGLLLGFWNLGAPDFPVVVIASVIGQFVGFASCIVLFPLVSTYYGGWLIAPVRAGTDLSSAITTFIAMAQNPNPGKTPLTFPTWVLFLCYLLISCCGLATWFWILRGGVGLRSDDEPAAQTDGSEDEETKPLAVGSYDSDDSCETSSTEDLAQRCWQQLENLACPRSLILPVTLATITQANQWALAISFGYVGAVMTDPVACDGEIGQSVYRWSLTLSQTLVPACSLLSSLAKCPRWVFVLVSLGQYAATALVCLATLGLPQRDFWTSTTGQWTYVASYALCGGLEGYVITMAYRYIGDAAGISLKLRHSASTLLSFLTVMSINVVGLYIGSIVATGQVACLEP